MNGWSNKQCGNKVRRKERSQLGKRIGLLSVGITKYLILDNL